MEICSKKEPILYMYFSREARKHTNRIFTPDLHKHLMKHQEFNSAVPKSQNADSRRN